MHGLLREALEAEAERQFPDALRRVHERASEWFQRIGESDLAIRHAIHSHDLVRAEMLVVDFAPLCRTRGMVSTFDRWLSAFPLAHVQSAPSLSLVAAMLSLGTDSTAVRAWTSLCGRTLAAGVTCDTDPQVELKFLAWQAAVWNGPIEDAIRFSAKAHRELPPGLWHTLACEAYGGHAFAAGHHELAGTLLAEGVAEARVFGARTMELLCAAHLAVVHHVDGHTERAVALALDTRRRVQEYELEHFPTLVVVTAVAAWAAALTGDLDATRRDLVVTRHCLALLDGVCAWATVQARLVAAEAAMLLGDRVMAATLLKEASVTLAGQPDAVTPHRQWAELEQQLVTTRQNLPVGPSALSTAELRVVHYLPTNLSIAEIGERLYVSRHTTKSHVAAIYRKLGTSSRQETVEACRAAGLLPSSWMSDD
jgi:LuxR family maltose regulon positive regulatory protein